MPSFSDYKLFLFLCGLFATTFIKVVAMLKFLSINDFSVFETPVVAMFCKAFWFIHNRKKTRLPCRT